MANALGFVDDVLRFWFRELTPRDWWEKHPAVDFAIARRFAPLHDRLSREASPSLFVTADQQLAAVIVLDQLSRHLYRGDRRSFTQDSLALSIAEAAVSGGFDRQLGPSRRRFLYLPYEHSERRDVQAHSVALFATLGSGHADSLEYALQHKMIIDRFGRFPHRNKVLGRATTPEETVFLQQPGSSF